MNYETLLNIGCVIACFTAVAICREYCRGAKAFATVRARDGGER